MLLALSRYICYNVDQASKANDLSEYNMQHTSSNPTEATMSILWIKKKRNEMSTGRHGKIMLLAHNQNSDTEMRITYKHRGCDTTTTAWQG